MRLEAFRSMASSVARTATCALALLVSACGSGDATYQCTPSCPAHTHCTASGCALDDDGSLDLAVAPPADLAAECLPACAGSTPWCKNGLCQACLTDEHCPVGQVCRPSGGVSVCLPGCSGDGRCPAGLSCCDGACTDTAKDASNCGGCGKPCAVAHAASQCSAGRCSIARCTAPWQDCNADATDGCEVNLHHDTANCGACGMACAPENGVPGCAAEGCYVAACSFGWDDCDGSGANGCEIQVATDPKNCGACGSPCLAVPRAQVSCALGQCAVQACSNGFGDCNLVYNDGCETNLLNDKNNCGRCGLACAQNQICNNGQCDCPVCTFQNAKGACVNKQCVIASCNAGWADCDGSTINGCEMPIASNLQNCGACGNACAKGLVCKSGGCTCPQCNIPNAVTDCVNNQCVLKACLPGFADCDKNVGNGCEVDISGDAKNCGACGNACGQQKPYCLAGACDSVGLSCVALLQQNPKLPSGPYLIDPDGAGGNAAFTAYCDMTDDGGGWTLVAKVHRVHSNFSPCDEVDTWFARSRDTATLGDATSYDNRLPGQSSWGQTLLSPLAGGSKLSRFVIIAEADPTQRARWFKELAPDMWLWFGQADHTATKVCTDVNMTLKCSNGKLRGSPASATWFDGMNLADWGYPAGGVVHMRLNNDQSAFYDGLCSYTNNNNNNQWNDTAFDGHWGNGLEIWLR